MSEVPAAEPPTDGVALADPATARALRGLRLPLVTLPVAAAVSGVPAILLSGLASALLTIAALAFVIGTLIVIATTGFWIGPATKLLRTRPWRPARVRVYRALKGLPRTPLRLREPDGTTVDLLAPALSWSAQQVLARTGAVWIVGPDERGWAAIRSPGLALPLGQARVADIDVGAGYQISPVQASPRSAATAAEDAVLARAIAGPRRRSRTDLVAPALLLAFAVFVLVDLLRRGVAGRAELLVGLIAATALIVGLLAWRVHRLRHWGTVQRLLSAGPWTRVPATLAEDRATAEVKLPDGRTATVRFHRPSQALLANIAATGQLWTAGPPADGPVAVGLPGYPFLAVARIG
ncbi:hypothetical protein [Actinokineospora sp. UTMC 2448]|uniref:hypothetical protein n=1 Tax=Actinokineospora sp. UTMC 2448 TaxID=2268449 RepID=UPI002164D311|nr:hypothetical protein [Actinokineospora sp. UTMC 2448]UVS76421.1 hypothetical protein Actkin_00108 [Actinokineospora sp. UTMC 2448]